MFIAALFIIVSVFLYFILLVGFSLFCIFLLFFPTYRDPLTFQGRFNVDEFLVFASQSSLSLLFYLLIFLSKVYWVSNLKPLSALWIHHDTPWPAKVLQRNQLIWTISLCRPLQIYDVLTVQTCAALFRVSLGCKFPFSLMTNHWPCLLCPYPVEESLCMPSGPACPPATCLG